MSELIKMDDLIIVKQIPVIEEQLRLVSASVDEKLAIAKSLACSEESVKEVKKIRAEFNKEFDEIETVRKAVKIAVMTPYNDFEAVYKEHVGNKYKEADAVLKTKIVGVEDELKARKLAKVRAYFDEYAVANGVGEYANFDRQMTGLRASYTIKEFHRICQERIDPLVSGLKAIDAQPEELRAEILAEFKKELSANVAITTVAERRKAIEAAKEAHKEREARQAAEAEAAAKVESTLPPPLPPPLSPPVTQAVAEDDPVLKVTFTVTGKKSRLIELKRFLVEGGYRFE